MAIAVQWLKGLKTTEDKESFEQTLRNSNYVLGKLKDILQDEIAQLENITTADFDTPNWANKQAYRMGKKASLTYVLNLLEFK